MPNPKRLAQEGARQGSPQSRNKQNQDTERQSSIPDMGHKPDYRFDATKVATLHFLELYYLNGTNGQRVMSYGEVVEYDASTGGLLTSSNRLTRKIFHLSAVRDGKAIPGKRLGAAMEAFAAEMLDTDRQANGATLIKVPMGDHVAGEDIILSSSDDELIAQLQARGYEVTKTGDAATEPQPASTEPAATPASAAPAPTSAAPAAPAAAPAPAAPPDMSALMSDPAFEAWFQQRIDAAMLNAMSGGAPGPNPGPGGGATN